MNFMIDADEAHPTHSSFPNGRYRGYTFARVFQSSPFSLSLSLKVRDGRNREGKVSAYRETSRVQKTSSVIPDPINRRASAKRDTVPTGIVRRSNALRRSPVLEYVSVANDGNWLLKFRDNRGKF